MPYSPIKVANEFLKVARESNPPNPLTPLKLLKLVYMAHGWSLHYFRRPLVSEQAQAWQYGPVMPSLYFAIKSYRDSPVSSDIVGDNDPQELAPQDRALISAVLRSYGALSGLQLSNMTHTTDTPWFDAWHTNGRNSVIPNDVILRHYDAIAARKSQNGNSEINAA